MIKCALKTPELEFVYGTTKQAIQAKLDAGNPFNVDSYMKYLYERIQKTSVVNKYIPYTVNECRDLRGKYISYL